MDSKRKIADYEKYFRGKMVLVLKFKDTTLGRMFFSSVYGNTINSVILDKVYFNGSYTRYRIRYGNKTGWIKPNTAKYALESNKLFKELLFCS